MPPTSVVTAPFSVSFGREPGAELGPDAPFCALPVLGGSGRENLFPPATSAGTSGHFRLYRAGEWTLGWASLSVRDGDAEDPAWALYREMLEATRGRHLCRVWNYVPHINAHINGEETYRKFCSGRARAFEAEFGAGQFEKLCAASAVGAHRDLLAVVFAAADGAPSHHENPAQLPAYQYPPEHGPRAPSFARATVTADGRTIFVSGTAAIKGHSTVAPGETAAQIDCTLDNLGLISGAVGLGSDLGASGDWQRHFKIYLRHAADFPLVSAQLQRRLLRAADQVVWLQADICRAELNLEIEATLIAD